MTCTCRSGARCIECIERDGLTVDPRQARRIKEFYVCPQVPGCQLVPLHAETCVWCGESLSTHGRILSA